MQRLQRQHLTDVFARLNREMFDEDLFIELDSRRSSDDDSKEDHLPEECSAMSEIGIIRPQKVMSTDRYSGSLISEKTLKKECMISNHHSNRKNSNGLGKLSDANRILELIHKVTICDQEPRPAGVPEAFLGPIHIATGLRFSLERR